QMRGITGNEHAAVLEAISDQTAADPVLLRDDLEFEVRIDSKNLPNRPAAIDRLVIRLVIVEEIVDQPRLLSVDRHDGAAAPRVKGEIHPSRFAGQQTFQRRRTEASRLHALVFRNPGKLGTNSAANRRPATVATHEVTAVNRHALAAVEIARQGRDALRVLRELGREGRQSIVVTIRRAVFDGHVLAYD